MARSLDAEIQGRLAHDDTEVACRLSSPRMSIDMLMISNTRERIRGAETYPSHPTARPTSCARSCKEDQAESGEFMVVCERESSRTSKASWCC